MDSEPVWHLYLPDARAAIEAMREPTPDMVEANGDAKGPTDQVTISDWKAMIDAALTQA